ncbi:condensation domain-containing protein [Streptomyces sp. NEAU-Y11]|uniref:condensation domain-containing protein n=1 Tax=Streptomyces cucumeris TaxID=2962890 RepID=UPI0020C92218|nr:condensation domain-containing protein [Streptomyces sp. NEAU-Y11]MCP9211174.1 condensation domain-containing protein [Streptomyces sp. NEAU-Y11]
MEFEDLVRRIREEDVQVSVVDGRLAYDGPQQALTEDLLAMMRLHKQRLMEVAATGPVVEASGPATLSQQRMLAQCRRSSTPQIWNIPLRIDLIGEVDVSAMSWALSELVQRHHALRTRLVSISSGIVQEVLPADCFRLVSQDLRGPSVEPAPEATVDAWCSQLARTPFDLANGPALRAHLGRVDDARWVLVIVQHHVITDATSGSVLIREFGALYAAAVQGAGSPLASTPCQFTDYARWQRRYLDADCAARLTAFWRETLAGARFDMPLRGFKRCPEVRTGAGAVLRTVLGPEIIAPLRGLCRTRHITLYTVLLLALSRILSRGTGRNDLVVTGSFGNREDEEIASMIGLVANSVALRLRSQENLPVGDVLTETAATVAAAMSHQALPISQVLESLDLGDDRADLDGFPRVWLTLNTAVADGLELPGAEVMVSEIPVSGTRSDLGIVAYQSADSIELNVEYSTETLDAAAVQEFVDAFSSLLTRLPDALHEPWEQWLQSTGQVLSEHPARAQAAQ